MMRYPLLITLCLLLICATLIIGYDIWLDWRGGAKATISWHTFMASQADPIIPLAIGLILGILLGHLFWPNHQ